MSLNSLNLEKTYGKKIMFKKMETHGKFESYLVASSDIDLESAIICAYDIGSADKIGDNVTPLGWNDIQVYKLVV